MKMLFTVQGKNFTVNVSDDREVSFSSELTNNKYITYDELAKQPGNNPKEVAMAKLIVKSLPSMKDVEDYIKLEFGNKGLIHVKTV